MSRSTAIEMKHAGSRALHTYWNTLRAGRAAPYKAEVTASGLGPELSDHVFILESLGSGAFRFRSAGAALYDIFGMEMRGMGAEATMEGESRRRFVGLAEQTLAAGDVGVARGDALGDSPTLALEFILLPLLSDFGRADRLLGAVHVAPGDGAPEEAVHAARRCRLRETGVISAAARPRRERAQPLPGFAEPAASFRHDRSAAQPSGAGAARMGADARRRDHLKVVKD
ncbi:PAS domain-containing protein [Pikeienuella sp. HZG-20]|uniref:PAS domain-containing protein n=1 Tax=Paludibacillus litoralis TaxID=3133267 RepID=UPI0030EBDD89